jgi:cytochrome c-type biogenesis protein CcmH/NrfF
MLAPNSAEPAARPGIRQVVLWSVFATMLVLGIVLWFRFANRIVPMLDVFSGR